MRNRAAIFIDGAYLDNVLYDLGSIKINFGDLVGLIHGDVPLLRAYYYHCLPYQSPQPTPEESQYYRNKSKFFNALERFDFFEVRLGELVVRGVDERGNRILEQKGVDVQLAVDLLALSFNRIIDTAFLVLGDGDFVPAVQKAKDAGVSVRLLYANGPNSRVSERIWYACDQRTVMDRDFFQGCLWRE